MDSPPRSPESLPPGTLLDGWRLVAGAGAGTFGAVYRAEKVGHERSGLVALKIAKSPRDERFEREAELLSRIRSPHVPQLLGRGEYPCGPWRAPHPFIVMDWVEGVSLYEWARRHNPSSRKALQLLAQLSRALAATHAAECVHRDVKGDNVLVDGTGRAWLLDFGAGTWNGAPRLTDGPVAPGTRPYRSPQALRFQWEQRKIIEAHYEAGPADDVWSLGVTAYRMVTSVYPPPGTDLEARWENTRPARVVRRPAHEVNSLVCPELSALIERTLRDVPGARGSALELAQALEAAATSAGPEADLPLRTSADVRAEAVTVKTRHPGPPPRPGLSVAAPVLAIVALYCTVVLMPPATDEEQADAGVEAGGLSGLGDAAVSEVVVSREDVPSAGIPRAGIGMELPKQPFPGQRKPPCRPRSEVEIRGACWVPIRGMEPPCGNEGFDWGEMCVMASFDGPRPSTSDPP